MQNNKQEKQGYIYLTFFILMLIGLMVLIMFITSPPAKAKDFGIRGHVYKIEEEPFLKMIDTRLQKVDIQTEQDKMEKIVRKRVTHPEPVKGIKQAEKDRVWYFDPSYVLAEDITLPCGKVLHKKGTRINPLIHMDLERRIYFIDGRKSEQVAWLKEEMGKHKEENSDEAVEDRVLLVGGSVFEIREELRDAGKDIDEQVYFDQSGAFCQQFGLEFVPAILMQEGLRYKIEEVKI